MAYEGIELVRVNCGGAGYSAWSYLPELWSQYSPVPVYEGDNTVMAQQTVGYIQKKLVKISKGQPAEDYFAYLNNIDKLCSETSQNLKEEDFLDINFLEKCLSIRAAWIIRDVTVKLSDKKIKKKIALNDLFAQDLLYMSKMHHLYLSLHIYLKNVERHEIKDPKIRPILILLGKIFALK